MSKAVPVIALLSLFGFLLSNVYGHGAMILPNPRGALSQGPKYVKYPVLDRSNIDWKMHFPAGDKSSAPGSGLRSMKAAAGPKGWVPYKPFSPNFKWRAGVCGDRMGVKDHLKGGKYYNDGYIVKTYTQGGIINVVTAIAAHHNGFFELYVCDVSHCPNRDISRACFRRHGACRQLYRARGDACESRTNTACAPADPNYPGRWYFPCEKYATLEPGNWTSYGPNTARFRLPGDLVCEHCVLQWYWVAANSCNPPGVIEFFEGPRGPLNWRNCKGQGGALGGYTKVQKPCGAKNDRFPEEYYQCSDIRIVPPPSSVRQNVNNTGAVIDYFNNSVGPLLASNVALNATSPSVSTTLPVASLAQKDSAKKVSSQAITTRTDLHLGFRASGSWEMHCAPRTANKGIIQDIVLVSEGTRVSSLLNCPLVSLKGISNITVETVTAEDLTEVNFKVVNENTGETVVNNKQRSKSKFYMHGQSTEGPTPWTGIPVNQLLHMTITANRNNTLHSRSVHVILAA